MLSGAVAAATAAFLVALALGPAPRTASANPRAVLAHLRALLDPDRSGAAAAPILQATHAGLRSGLPLVGALHAALAPYDARTRRPFDDVVRAVELNADVDSAVADVRGRVRDRRVLAALDAIALGSLEDLPASRAAALVASIAERLSFEAHVHAEIEARASGVRTQIVILALVVPAFAVYLVATMPGLAATLGTPLATHVLVPLALTLEIAGIAISRRVVMGLEL